MPTRYDPFSTLLPFGEAMNQVLVSRLVTPARQFVQPMHSVPIELYETDEAFLVKAFTLGLLPEQIEISVEQDTVTIRGETKSNMPQNARVVLNELQPGLFVRRCSLPLPIDADKVEARIDNGVLFLVLPKAKAAKPCKIQVTAA